MRAVERIPHVTGISRPPPSARAAPGRARSGPQSPQTRANSIRLPNGSRQVKRGRPTIGVARRGSRRQPSSRRRRLARVGVLDGEAEVRPLPGGRSSTSIRCNSSSPPTRYQMKELGVEGEGARRAPRSRACRRRRPAPPPLPSRPGRQSRRAGASRREGRTDECAGSGDRGGSRLPRHVVVVAATDKRGHRRAGPRAVETPAHDQASGRQAAEPAHTIPASSRWRRTRRLHDSRRPRWRRHGARRPGLTRRRPRRRPRPDRSGQDGAHARSFRR